MVDLDAIKAAGLNSDAESQRLLDLHRWRAAVALHGDLCAKYLRDNPGCTSADYDWYCNGAAVSVGLAA